MNLVKSKGSQANLLFEIKEAPEIEVAYFHAHERISEPYLLNVALAKQDDLVGKPFKRWFFRKQSVP